MRIRRGEKGGRERESEREWWGGATVLPSVK